MKSYHGHEIISCSSNHIMFMKSYHDHEIMFVKPYCYIVQELQCRKSSAATEVEGVDSRDWGAGSGVQRLQRRDRSAKTEVQ